MKHKLYLYNPQLNGGLLGKTVQDFFDGSKVPGKHEYLKDLIKNGIAEIIVIDDFSSLKKNYNNKLLLRLIFFLEKIFFKYIEVYLWLITNSINLFRVKIHYNFDMIKPTDFLFLFSNINLDRDRDISKNVQSITSVDCKKIIHLSHYIFFTKKISDNCSSIKNLFYAAENNLKKNSKYFNKYFSYYQNEFLTLPFVAKKRYKNIKKFSIRNNICLSLGSFEIRDASNLSEDLQNMNEFYNEFTIHPLRAKIYEKRKELEKFIYCLNSPILKNQNFKKRKYYDLDIVKIFNSYNMFICGEELGGLPGVSFVEGMMCGAAYLGEENFGYEDFGMKNGVNYISHDGSLEDVIAKIEYYQKNTHKLEKIASNGYLLADKIFNKKNAINSLQNFIAKYD